MKSNKNIFNNNRGFSFIEILVSLALLGIITISFLPIFVLGIKSSTNGKNNLVATKLATSQIEWLKTLDYNNELGLKKTGYKPNGIVEENLFMNEENTDPLIIDGVEYRIRTRIYWESGKSTTDETIENATKKVDITVYTRDAYSGQEEDFSVLGTLIAFEGQRDPTIPGNIKIYTLWNIDKPKKNVLVQGRGPTIEYTYTDDDGLGILAELQPGEYEVKPESWDLGEIMIRPLGVIGSYPNKQWLQSQKLTVPRWDHTNKPIYPDFTFYVGYPARLKLPNGYNFSPSTKMIIKPSSESLTPPEGAPEDFMTLDFPLNKLNNTNLWWDWYYEYSVTDGTDNYFITLKNNGLQWDGRFSIPNNRSIVEDILLNIGLREEAVFSYVKAESKQIKAIELEFTASVKEFNSAEFQIGEESVIKLNDLFTKKESLENLLLLDNNENSYFVEHMDSRNGLSNKIKIYIYDPNNLLVFNKDVKSTIKITNPNVVKNQYGIELAPYSSTAIIKVRD